MASAKPFDKAGAHRSINMESKVIVPGRRKETYPDTQSLVVIGELIKETRRPSCDFSLSSIEQVISERFIDKQNDVATEAEVCKRSMNIGKRMKFDVS